MSIFNSSSIINLPSWTDLRAWTQPVYDQLSIGSCTGFSVKNALEATSMRIGQSVDLSALELYYDGRKIMGTEASDSGCTIKNVLNGAMNGVDTEQAWPYAVDKVLSMPVQSGAMDFEVLSYESIYLDPDSLIARDAAIKSALAQGYFVMLETNINNQFMGEHRPLGEQALINPQTSNPLSNAGRHALNEVGYGFPGTFGMLISENSWSESWGDHGYGLLNSNWYSDKAYIITGIQVNGSAYDFHWTLERLEVNALYCALFRRAADYDGMEYWTGKLLAGESWYSVGQDMYNISPVGETHQAMVDAFYGNILSRAPDASGKSYWLGKLDAGELAGQLCVEIIFSALNYSGVDHVALQSQQFLKNEISFSMYESVMCANNNASIYIHALDNITSDPSSVEIAKIGLAHDLLAFGWS